MKKATREIKKHQFFLRFFFLQVSLLSLSNLPDHFHAHAPRRRRHALRHAPQGNVRGQVRCFYPGDLEHRRGRDAADRARGVPGLLRPLRDSRRGLEQVRSRRRLHGVVVGLVGVGGDADRDRGSVLKGELKEGRRRSGLRERRRRFVVSSFDQANLESPALSLSFFLLLFSFSTPPPPQSILLDSLYPLQQKSNKKLTLIPLVAALKSLQNAMMFRPACPSAGPTGGAGLACPAPIRRRMEAEMAFLDILVNSIQARKREKRERWRLFSSRASESEKRRKVWRFADGENFSKSASSPHNSVCRAQQTSFPFSLKKETTNHHLPKMATSKISPDGLRDAITSECWTKEDGRKTRRKNVVDRRSSLQQPPTVMRRAEGTAAASAALPRNQSCRGGPWRALCGDNCVRREGASSLSASAVST